MTSVLPSNGSRTGLDNQKTDEFPGAAVSRSGELLSCAKTALNIQKQKLIDEGQDDHPLLTWTAVMLELHPRTAPAAKAAMLEDGCTLLRGMQFGLKKLQGLVRRRGHTNDPTEQISELTRQLEQDAQELTKFIEGVQKMGIQNKQSQRHWQLVATWFQQVAADYGTQMKEILKLRGTVLAEQAQRRKRVVSQQQSQNNGTSANGSAGAGGMTTPAARPRTRRPLAGSAASATPLFDSPLFTAAPSKASNRTSNGSTFENGSNQSSASSTFDKPPPQNGAQSQGSAATSTSAQATHGASSFYGSGGSGGYGGKSSGTSYGGSSGGYGGASSSSTSTLGQTGMRQRRGGGGGGSSNATADNDKNVNESQAVQMQIQERQQRRQTAQRLAEAQQAEQQLGELGSLFGKMSTLISSQGEVLEKIEDDVEAALVDVEAGQNELTKLHAIKKGNRGLIIKTFAILNFLICFMKLYKK